MSDMRLKDFRISDVKKLRENPKYGSFYDVGLFILLIFSFHFIYLGWQAIDFWPVRPYVDDLFQYASSLLFDQSCNILENVLGIDIITIDRSIGIMNNEGRYSFVTVAPECTSLKQWLHWLFLMLLFPGPWKHKLWYIPLGLVIIEWVNVVRITGILLLMRPFPNSFSFSHDYLFKTLFYFVIFLMWVLWTELFLHKKNKRNDKTKSNCHEH